MYGKLSGELWIPNTRSRKRNYILQRSHNATATAVGYTVARAIFSVTLVYDV